MNPNNLPPDVEHKHDNVTNLYYSNTIASNFPRAVSIVCLVLTILSITSTILIRMPGARWLSLQNAQWEEDMEALAHDDIYPSLTTCETLSSGTFWKLYIMAVLASFFGSYMYSVAKPFGLMKNGDDHFNTLALTMAGLIGGSLRFLWTWAIDQWGFKKIGTALFLMIILVACTLPSVASVKALYFIWIVLSVACDAAIIAVFPAVCALAFGIEKGTLAFSFLFSGIALILVGGSLLSEFAVD